ncbi:hypothetical protein CRG98_023144 [Punica granatum]|uniref:Integrase catalytic domain-containing protein n=1 Tax=Punica granatum TaxID=22663 RepID=A0A2I0JLV2_PUNGR|nr:hypothetical protein CRG98_023144 [Punica granatum]
MAVHMSNFQDIVNQLTNLEIILPDELQACLLLGTLPDNWDTLVVVLSNSAPNGKLSLATGHYKRECKALKKNQNGNGESKKEEDTTTVAYDGETYIVCDEAYVNFTCQDSTRVVDTGALFHITPHRDFFSSYTIGDYGYVKMGNEQSCKIVGIGDVCLETELGCKLLLKKVRHVLEIRLNLISTGQLDDEGYNNEFSDERWKFSKGSLIVARGQKTDTLYRLRARHNSGQVNVAEDYPIELWHRRLGHISEKVERETDMKLKCVRADNSGEYRGPFENYCRTHGIKLEKTVPKTPQQNGLAERMNRTIVERVRCMLFQAKLSKSFWGEAMRIAVDLINLTPSVALDGDKNGVDFEEIFLPVVKMSSIRVVLALAANLNLEIEQLDVKTAFLHGDLEEEIYMEQPEGFRVKGKEHLVCRLRKSLYELKQASRQWYKKFDSFMLSHGYTRTTSNHCVFVKQFSDGDFIILLLYVDDMLLVGHDMSKIADLKKELNKSFAMKDLGPVKQILGMHISHCQHPILAHLSKQRYQQ